MLKFIGGALVGVFVGALVLEVLKRRRPGVAEFVERRAKRLADDLLDEPQSFLEERND